MLQCNECKVFFFSKEGRDDHKNICIGYKPNEVEYDCNKSERF